MLGTIFQSLFADAKVGRAIKSAIGFRLLANLKFTGMYVQKNLATDERKSASSSINRHSDRSATTGSIASARRAAIPHASNEITANTRLTTVKLTGSRSLIPYI